MLGLRLVRREAHRGQRLYQALAEAAKAEALDGIKRAIATVDVVNAPALKVKKRDPPSRPLGSVFLLRAFGVSLRHEARSGSTCWPLYRGAWPASLADGATISASSAPPS